MKKIICLIGMGMTNTFCGTETIDKRIKNFPSEEKAHPDDSGSFESVPEMYLLNHPDSFIECKENGSSASDCRLREGKDVILSSSGSEEMTYKVSYQYNCGSGKYFSGLMITADKNEQIGVQLFTDSMDDFQVSGIADLKLVISDSSEFRRGIFNTGCHLLINAEIVSKLNNENTSNYFQFRSNDKFNTEL